MDDFKQIKNVQELIDILNEEPETACEFFVQLPLGRSWKTISLCNNDNKKIWVLNQIDDSEEFITFDELKDETSRFGNFIKRGKLYFAWR